jgi:hypothetical protein
VKGNENYKSLKKESQETLEVGMISHVHGVKESIL